MVFILEYTISSNIKKLLTDDFLNEFLYQLIRITGISPYDFADEGIDICQEPVVGMLHLERLVLTRKIRNYLTIEIRWNGMIQTFLIQK